MPEDMIRWLHTLFLPAAQHRQEHAWQPALDVYEASDGWLIKCDLAGVRPEDVSVTLQGRRLTIQGVRRDWTRVESCRLHRMEISYSRFERTLELPEPLERVCISREFQEGMLLLRLTKEACK